MPKETQFTRKTKSLQWSRLQAARGKPAATEHSKQPSCSSLHTHKTGFYLLGAELTAAQFITSSEPCVTAAVNYGKLLILLSLLCRWLGVFPHHFFFFLLRYALAVFLCLSAIYTCFCLGCKRLEHKNPVLYTFQYSTEPSTELSK